MASTALTAVSRKDGDASAPRVRKGGFIHGHGLWLLILPALLFFIVFFVVPTASLFGLAFNKSVAGVITLSSDITFDNFVRIFTRPIYYESILRSAGISAVVALVCLVFGYPLAYVIAKTVNPGRNTMLMILVLSSMQLDMVIRLYGLMVLLGDNGLINGALLRLGIISAPLPLMYNIFGVVVGLVQITLPFMVRTVGAAFRKDELRSLEEAARSLGRQLRAALPGRAGAAVLPAIGGRGSLMVFTLSVGEFNLTWMLHTPLTRTLPVGLADSYASMRIEVGSAYTLVFLIVILPVLWGLQAVGTFIEKHHGT